MRNKITIFGGTSGLAKKVIPDLESYGFNVNALSSKECDVRDYDSVFNQVKESDISLYFSVVNYDNLISNLVDEQIDHSIDVNIKGFINVSRAVSQCYSQKKYGRLIYISSILSSSPIKGTSIYSSSKSFCDTMIKVFAQENGKYGVTANSIQLGYFDGGLTYKVPEGILESVKKNIPNKRFGNINELSSMINHIIQNEYLNGSIIKLTGGLN
jgi:3-oxoacyl-[acyl-carrier protein] reductase